MKGFGVQRKQTPACIIDLVVPLSFGLKLYKKEALVELDIVH